MCRNPTLQHNGGIRGKYATQGPAAVSLLLKSFAVIFPAVALWSIANSENNFRSVQMANAVSVYAPIVAALVALVLLSKATAWAFCWWINKNCDPDSLKLALFHFVRDSGLFDTLMGILSLQNVGHILRNHPTVIWTSLNLLWNRKLIYYSRQSAAQYMEIFLPLNENEPNQPRFRGLLVFVHGGAWGSGNPTMYRLVATPFLKMNFAVAIVGYRTYPEGDASTQIQDLELALAELARQGFCSGNVILVGHSSGAHISLLLLVERARRRLETAGLQWQESLVNIDSFIGISGPYNIDYHFDFEAGRGVEELSPMKPACGNSREMFLRYSPAEQLSNMFDQCRSQLERQVLRNSFPRITLVHGTNDHTVPSSSSEEAARVLKSSGVTDCKEIYVKDTEHEQAIMEIMLGGPLQEIMTSLLAA